MSDKYGIKKLGREMLVHMVGIAVFTFFMYGLMRLLMLLYFPLIDRFPEMETTILWGGIITWGYFFINGIFYIESKIQKLNL